MSLQRGWEIDYRREDRCVRIERPDGHPRHLKDRCWIVGKYFYMHITIPGPDSVRYLQR